MIIESVGRDKISRAGLTFGLFVHLWRDSEITEGHAYLGKQTSSLLLEYTYIYNVCILGRYYGATY